MVRPACTGVPRRFQWVGLWDRFFPMPSSSQQPGVPIAFKVSRARGLEGQIDALPAMKSPQTSDKRT
jgi:hypothetical protein